MAPHSLDTRPPREVEGKIDGPESNLQRPHEAGVSVWPETLSRQLLRSGGFAALSRDFSVRLR